MKTFKIIAQGVTNPIIQGVIDKFNGAEANNGSVYSLDREIAFIVIDCKLAHGNLNKADRSAWISPRNNDQSFNVSISW